MCPGVPADADDGVLALEPPRPAGPVVDPHRPVPQRVAESVGRVQTKADPATVRRPRPPVPALPAGGHHHSMARRSTFVRKRHAALGNRGPFDSSLEIAEGSERKNRKQKSRDQTFGNLDPNFESRCRRKYSGPVLDGGGVPLRRTCTPCVRSLEEGGGGTLCRRGGRGRRCGRSPSSR